MMPQRVYSELAKVMPSDCMVTIDAGVSGVWPTTVSSSEEPRTMFNYAGPGRAGHGVERGAGNQAGQAR